MKIKVQDTTPKNVRQLVFKLLDILSEIGIPTDKSDRRLERMAKACLAVGNIRKSFKDAISETANQFLKTRDIIAFENKYLGENISPGSYDDVRRLDLQLLVEAGIIINSASKRELATNSPNRGYALSAVFAELLQFYSTDLWNAKLEEFKAEIKSLKEELEKKRELQKIPVTLPNGKFLDLSFGEHNTLQKAIIEFFLPLFGFGAEVLYVGDTNNKFLYIEEEKLKELNFFTLEHEELPDVIAYSKEKNLLYLIEAYHSTGEWNEIRVRKISRKLQESGCIVNTVFFTAFENKNVFRTKAKDIAWETEVWIADSPEHLVHFNGYKFLEIHK